MIMKAIKSILFVFLILVSAISCNKEDVNEPNPNHLEITGILVRQGITTYMYGTHVLSGYALRSSGIDLYDYEDQTVSIIGYKVEGYPVDFGPEYIEVVEIK